MKDITTDVIMKQDDEYGASPVLVNRGISGIFSDVSLRKTRSRLNSSASSSKHSSLQGDSSSSCGNFDDVKMKPEKSWYTYFSIAELALVTLILIIGVGSGVAFLIVGIKNEYSLAYFNLEKEAAQSVGGLQLVFNEYETVVGLLHEHITFGLLNEHEELDSLYDHIRSGMKGFHESLKHRLVYQAIGYIPNATHDERDKLENETLKYLLTNYPKIAANFTGFKGLEDDGKGGIKLDKRSEQPFYFPVLFMEPLDQGNEGAVGFDLFSNPGRKKAILEALRIHRPVVTEPIKLVQEKDPIARSVIMFHPGLPTSNTSESRRDLANIVIRIPDLLERANKNSGFSDGTGLYLYDTTNTNSPEYLGVIGQHLINTEDGSADEFFALQSLKDDINYVYFEDSFLFAEKQWTVIMAQKITVDQLAPVILGGCFMIFSSLILVGFFICMLIQQKKIIKVKLDAKQAEKLIIIQNEKGKIQAERDLNNYIAHAVRNPLSAAISACSLISEHITRDKLKEEPENIQAVQEDVAVIGVSLKYINELLRITLELHRTELNGSVELKTERVCICKDVFEPVKTILESQPRSNITILAESSPADLSINSDCARLEQVVMSICTNASKFVTKGFIRMKAIKSGIDTVDIYVEDSGKGKIPKDREKLFSKPYEDRNLGAVNQYTGMALHLCHKQINLMNGEMWVDESYNSGIKDFPGSRLVIRLRTKIYNDTYPCCVKDPKQITPIPKQIIPNDQDANSVTPVLPTHLKLLLVDDEMILRMLLARIVKRVCPEWEVAHAASGEDSLKAIKENDYDVIFMDQYMADVDNSLCGTETVREMRKAGVKSVIVGLSANDAIKSEFINAGANYFVCKPFPSEKEDCAKLFQTWLSKPVHHHEINEQNLEVLQECDLW